jgi:DNA primase
MNARELKYLKKRGIGSRYFIDTYEISSGGISGDFAHRIVFPIYYNGIAVSATARTTHKDVLPKYWTLPPDKEVIHHKSILFNWDDVVGIPVLVEGPVDSIKGGPGFVSSFGAQLTEEQLLLLSTKKKVFTLFDSDPTGRKQAAKYCSYLDVLGVDVEMLYLKDFHDMGAMPLDEIDGVRRDLEMEEIYD